MNGASAVLPVTTISNPSNNRTKTIGASHSFFLTFKNNQNSLRILTLLMLLVPDNLS
jgi:hypothetical protein